MTPSGIEPATFRLVAQCPNQLRHYVPPGYVILIVFSTATLVTRTRLNVNLLKPTGYVVHQQFNIQQLYVLPTLYLCVLYLSENKQRLVPLTA